METYNGVNMQTEFPKWARVSSFAPTAISSGNGSAAGDRKCFSTPKPVALIRESIRAASDKNSVVLDFFAGSGTAGHATMALNKEDGGNRRFILITNNESNICRNVTVPRLRSAIELENFDSGFTFMTMME